MRNSINKKFRNVSCRDYIYYVSPLSNDIKSAMVHGVALDLKKGIIKLRMIKDFTQYSDKIKPELVLQTHLEHDSNVFQDVIVPLDQESALLLQEYPTVIFTTEDKARAWKEGKKG